MVHWRHEKNQVSDLVTWFSLLHVAKISVNPDGYHLHSISMLTPAEDADFFFESPQEWVYVRDLRVGDMVRKVGNPTSMDFYLVLDIRPWTEHVRCGGSGVILHVLNVTKKEDESWTLTPAHPFWRQPLPPS